MLEPLPIPKDTLILVVDDLFPNLKVVGSMLEQVGYTVCYARSGPQALDVLSQVTPHLILLDLMMPEMDGFQVCEILKQDPINCEIPVIFLTASQEREHLLQAFAVGAVDYLIKPFSPPELLARVQTHLELRHNREQLKHLMGHIQRLNTGLEKTVEQRTEELQRAIAFEATLKRLTDNIRDSLDEAQIVKTAVRELVHAIHIDGCNAGIYDLAKGTSVVTYEYAPSLPSTLGMRYSFSDFQELYTHLHQGNYTQFCWHPIYFRDQCAVDLDYASTCVLICPIWDDCGILGDLWAYRRDQSGFADDEVALVRQVATQCAIAIRQARLYRAAQQQVYELERLNHLKNDFLSTISHELRTPMANIEMMSKMLAQVFEQAHLPAAEREQGHICLKVLQKECEREMGLINDLLDLVRLDAETEPLLAERIDLHMLVPHVAEPFVSRIQPQNLQLKLSVPPNVPPIVTDATMLKRVLTELLTNACKYTPEGETIEVKVRQKAKNMLAIAVINSGIDLPTDELERIFDTFYRVPNNDPWKYGGTGLGLALVKKQMRYLGGAVQAYCRHHRFAIVLHLPFDPRTVPSLQSLWTCADGARTGSAFSNLYCTMG